MRKRLSKSSVYEEAEHDRKDDRYREGNIRQGIRDACEELLYRLHGDYADEHDLWMLFADENARTGILYCWGMAGMMLIAVVFQLVFFSPMVIKRLSYVPRIVLFGISLYIVLAICAATQCWFPADNTGAWTSFTVIYLVILAILTAIFTLIYKRSVRELNSGLQRYKETSSRKGE